ncbi:hypothetical protein NQ314_013525 [Rhamnusium bicolor]|uniref:Uncharacterized protein n=1 Tax=Rhamnusium bicolor TaxID=1586634 RepID=A0AAV8X6M5_9CUCU|nr:hypothetical protein NQ314_013525 [Rhamnusium bicolor]
MGVTRTFPTCAFASPMLTMEEGCRHLTTSDLKQTDLLLDQRYPIPDSPLDLRGSAIEAQDIKTEDKYNKEKIN